MHITIFLEKLNFTFSSTRKLYLNSVIIIMHEIILIKSNQIKLNHRANAL